jgi:hypothetical protein
MGEKLSLKMPILCLERLLYINIFTVTRYIYLFIIFPKFFGKNFNRSIVFGNEIFSKLTKKNWKDSIIENLIIKKEKRIVNDLEKLQIKYYFFIFFAFMLQKN